FGNKTGANVGTRNLEMFSLDLTALATEGKIDPVIGREEEILRATQVLTRRHKNNVILVGPPGVGKTAIVEGLAMGIVTGDVPDVLQNKRILSLRVSELLAGTKYRGEFEERVKKIVEEIRNSNRSIILFIDELHTVMQTKGTEGAVNFSDILKKIKPGKIIILKGDKSEDFAEKYLENYKDIIQYFDIRLRWQDSKVQEFKKDVSKIPQKELVKYRKFMAEAEKEAEKSKCWWRQVGAVAVKDGKIIFRGFNKMLPSDDECYKIGCIRDSIAPGKQPEICSVTHAEATIISLAANEGVSLKDTTLYVTHFPCPACAKLVALAGFKKLVYSRGSSVFDGERVMASRGVDIVKI
ncbi:AAA family ATPase, partial [Patescibacteria group bacterium]|nr:AAA family ATPase [Patescibacteria group bacterium]